MIIATLRADVLGPARRDAGSATRERPLGRRGALGVGIAIVYVDRANLSAAAPQIQQEFGLSNTELGLILSGFFWAYALFQLFSGWFVDRAGVRVGHALAALLCSVFTAAALGCGFASLLGLRLLLGIGESPAYPEREGRPRVAVRSGARPGRGSTRAVHGSGRRSRSRSWCSPSGLRAGTRPHRGRAGGPRREGPDPWGGLLRHRPVRGMVLGNVCVAFVIYRFVTWFPTYLVEGRGFDLPSLGLFGSIPALVAVPTGWSGGLAPDALARTGGALPGPARHRSSVGCYCRRASS